LSERKIYPLKVTGVINGILCTVWSKISYFEKTTVRTIPVCLSTKILSEIPWSCRYAYHVPSTAFCTWTIFRCHKRTLTMSPSVIHFFIKFLLFEGLKEDTLPLNWVTKIRSLKDVEQGRGGRMIAALYITMMDAELMFWIFQHK
jgi:hypothetical protein